MGEHFDRFLHDFVLFLPCTAEICTGPGQDVQYDFIISAEVVYLEDSAFQHLIPPSRFVVIQIKLNVTSVPCTFSSWVYVDFT